MIVAISLGVISVMDWDGDGLRNFEEILGQTDWRDYDTDDDNQNDSEDPYPLIDKKSKTPENKVDESEENIESTENEMKEPENEILVAERLLWKKKVVGTFDEFAGVVARGETVYTVGKTMNNAPVTGTDANTGEIIWQTPVGSCDSTPVISDGRLFVINCMWDDFMVRNIAQPVNKERIWCLDKDTGAVIWSSEKVNPDGGGPLTPVPEKNLIYAYSTIDIYSDDPWGEVQAFKMDTGELVWSKGYEGTLTSGVFYENKIIISGTGGLAAYNAETGKKLWKNTEIKSWDSKPIIHEGNIMVGGGYGSLPLTLFVVNPNKGDIVWKWEDPKNGGTALTTPLVDDERVYFGGYSTIYAVDLNSRRLIWKENDGGYGPYSSPVISDEKIYYGTTTYETGSSDYIYARDAVDGSLIWKYEIETTGRLQGIFSQPLIYGEKLYITSDDGYLRCFRLY